MTATKGIAILVALAVAGCTAAGTRSVGSSPPAVVEAPSPSLVLASPPATVPRPLAAAEAPSYPVPAEFEIPGCPGDDADPSAVHRAAIVVDLHADSLQRWVGLPADQTLAGLQAGPQQLQKGGVDVQFYSLWVSPSDPDPAASVRKQLEAFRTAFSEGPAGVRLARSVEDVFRIQRSGRPVAFLGLEGALALEGDPRALRRLRDEGVAYVSLTWNETNPFGQGTLGKGPPGATAKGLALVREANALGVIPDVSHAAPETFWDVLTASRRPVIASHSNAAAVHPHARNLDDAQLWAIAESGGVIGLNLYSGFVSNRRPPATLPDLLRHAEHIRAVAGPGHLAIGSDFDGSRHPVAGLEDASRMGHLTGALLGAGVPAREVCGILGGNVLRVLRDTRAQPAPRPRVRHRPARVLEVTSPDAAEGIANLVDRNTLTAWKPASFFQGSFPGARVVSEGPGVDRVSLCASSPGRSAGILTVEVSASCDGRTVDGPIRATLGREVRPYRVELPGLAVCARPAVEVRIIGVEPSTGTVQLSEILCEQDEPGLSNPQ